MRPHQTRRRATVLLFAFVASLASLAPAHAAPLDLRVDVAVDVPIAAGAALAWIVSEAAKSSLAPSSCRWCGAPATADGPLDVNRIDRGTRDALRWSNTDLAHNLSNLAAFVVAPMAALGLSAVGARNAGEGPTFWTDALVMVESVALTALLNQIVKFSAGRERPYRAAQSEDERARSDPDGNLSFFSGHTSLAFALAVSSATIATMRDRPMAPALWAIGLPVAAAAGWLRIAADRHYFTDVLVGALVGSVIGFLVPWLHRARPSPSGDKLTKPVSWTLSPGAGSASFSVTW